MKFALVNNIRSQAFKGLTGSCPSCGSIMIPKCGVKNIHHWSHKGYLECDPWREHEKEWHRTWKTLFPIDCQEVVHRDEVTGEKHIADVKTYSGTVLEFQHSPITQEERKSRNDFYKNIVWIVDGKRLERDEIQFFKTYETGINIGYVKKICISDSSLVQKWSGMSVPVFFDFGQSVLWLLLPTVSDSSSAHIFPLSKGDFLEIFREDQLQKKELFWKFINNFIILLQHPRPQQMIYLNIPLRGNTPRGPRIDYIQNNNYKNRRRYRRF